MKILSALSLTAIGVLLTVAVAAPGASATTLEIEGMTKNEPVTMESSIKAGYSAILKDTFGISVNTCLKGTSTGSTSSPYSSTTITGSGSILQLSNCNREPIVVHKFGTLHISHINGTTNGTVTSSGAEVTASSVFGTITCKTGEGTHFGTLTGVSSGHAEIDVNATIPCGISLKLTSTRVITAPTGLGVSA